ncbi:MAG: aspartate 1-decarboxylase [Acidobacteriota bacterium]|jgi:L-aspartate-alpha-decarboxylase|nr:aspartate 1-decarboxylase [Acidobacteriota bacterium]OQB55349.1 MAG: Aspartate 1-decarboxylase precursor [Candidatus Aminicenantes bacterium ADurb.Bin147]HNQ80691.1 aspartate 1-decarboxylase [Candidatus Aminicenantes bacterium]MDD8010059.1 aspartate 1-decarboxylase [Acidobacteriota bacterium]MDD8028282.1 aspartate 1-decarboxylase [Acidobacteriota bacterium]
MRRTMLKSKIHRARVTVSDLHYEGSLGLDEDLMEAAGLVPYEKAHVYNVSNGARFSTYIIREERGSGSVAIYGAAAHRARPGDLLIIAAYAQFEETEIKEWRPKVVHVDSENRVKS